MIDVMIDIDDVLFPWADGIHERSRAAGLHDMPTYETWSMWEDYGVEKELWLDVVGTAALDGFYVDTPPVPGSVEALRRLLWAPDRVAIHLVTARGVNNDLGHAEEIREWTKAWVYEHAVPHKTLTFAKDKVATQQTLGVRFDFALDDGPHNYKALRNDGVPTFLMERPHNRHLNIWSGYRVATVDQFVDIVIGSTLPVGIN